MTVEGKRRTEGDSTKPSEPNQKTGGLELMRGHIYSQEEKEFFAGYIPGHTYKEIQEKFIKIFGWNITVGQIKGYMANHKINSGTKGHFPKGHVPMNKGKKGVCAAGSEKSWFKPGHIPTNHKPVGSERISKDGYVEIKVEEPSKWKLKHRVIWEKEYGPIGRNKCLIFLNGDTTDIRIENLMLIERKINARLNQSGLRYKDEESTRTAVNIAKISSLIGEKKRKRTN